LQMRKSEFPEIFPGSLFSGHSRQTSQSLAGSRRQAIIFGMSFLLTLADISGDTWSEEITPEAKILGRGESVEIRLDHTSVSRKHCRFWCAQGECFVEDLGSTNGTYVNGLKVQSEKLKLGDSIVVGRFELIVDDKHHVQGTVDLAEEALGSEVLLDQMAEERRLARTIHERLTPSRKMTLPGMKVEVIYRPSGALGGDCFESIELENRWILALFDPMSHGVKAALNGSLMRSELQRWVTLTAEPARCLQWINSELLRLGASDLYVCATIASWFPRTQSLVLATAGAKSPLLFHDGRLFRAEDVAGGMPLGVLPGEHYIERLYHLKIGDRIFLVSDGIELAMRGEPSTDVVTESASSTTSIAPPDILRLLADAMHEPLEAQLASVMSRAPETLLDDLLLVGCEVTPG
jgi:serine phosphatase RsbU (regulator of sigma subunit)